MKKIIIIIMGILISICISVQAENLSIENAIKNQPELSGFYDALVNTGVINDFYEGVSYTIFAPTNSAMEKMTKAKYPCFYSSECKGDVASILRNHIVAGKAINFPDQNSVFSVSGKALEIGKSGNKGYTVEGYNVISQKHVGGGIIYDISGVIATPQQLADLTQIKIPPGTTVMKNTVTNKVFYAPEGSKDGSSKITTITTTTVTK